MEPILVGMRIIDLFCKFCIVFLPARRYASAGLCYSDVSVCLSGRPSVTRRYCA